MFNRMRDKLEQKSVVFTLVVLLVGGILKPVDAYVDARSIDVAPQYGAQAITLYYSDINGAYLIPISRRVAPDTEVTPQFRLDEFIRGPKAGPELSGLVSPTTVVDSLFIKNGNVEIKLSEVDFTPGFEKRLVIDALIRSITEAPEVDTITLEINGQYVDTDGQTVSKSKKLKPDAAINTPVESGKYTATLYHSYGAIDQYLLPVTISFDDNKDIYHVIVEALMAGPDEAGSLKPSLPPDVRLRSVKFDSGVVYVDFSEELIYAYRLKQANALHVRKSVVATLTSLPEVYAVQIIIGGSSMLYYTCQNVVMEYPQSAPWAINDEFYLSRLDFDAQANQ